MSASLPTGTVTFLFTDIEGSTRLLEELGPERYSESLAEHRRILRGAFSSEGGVEVDTQGDAFFVAFPDATNALAAAVRAQAELAEGPIRVRMGIHSGAPLLTTEGYVGMDVHQGARVMSAGHGGQVLVSDVTRGLLDGGGGLTDLGLHRLKDLTEPQRLWQLGDADFPPLKTLFQTNLPVQPTALVGREEELTEVLGLLGRERLVTLTGPGGAGKTRLALQAAAELADAFKDGVWWVSLAALRDPGLVGPTIAQALGVKGKLPDAVRQKQALLLLDNFEHVVGAAPAVAELLAEAPDLRVLVTSRERLAVAAEHEYAIPPLELSDAVALFTARARQLKPDFEPDLAVAKIAERLDGLPLAVELAAARIKVLRTDQILERVDRSLEMLTSGHRDAPERHQTLRATIEWSYDLLNGGEQLLFARLAVFAGSFSLEAAEQVCDADLETLAALVDKSLVRQTEESRFFLLETIREFAADRLDDGADVLARRHAVFYAALADAAPSGEGGKSSLVVDWLRADLANLRAALVYFRREEAIERELRLATAMVTVWMVLGHVREGRATIEDALARSSGLPPDVRMRALARAADLARASGDVARALEVAEEALELADSLGDARGRAAALHELGEAATAIGDYERAETLFEAAIAAAREAGGSPLASLSNLGDVALARGDLERALAVSVEVVARAREPGMEYTLAIGSFNLASALVQLGRFDEAQSPLRDALEECAGYEFQEVTAWCLLAAAGIVASVGDTADAAAIVACSDALLAENGLTLWPSEKRLREHVVATFRLDSAPAMPLGQALELVRSYLDLR